MKETIICRLAVQGVKVSAHLNVWYSRNDMYQWNLKFNEQTLLYHTCVQGELPTTIELPMLFRVERVNFGRVCNWSIGTSPYLLLKETDTFITQRDAWCLICNILCSFCTLKSLISTSPKTNFIKKTWLLWFQSILKDTSSSINRLTQISRGYYFWPVNWDVVYIKSLLKTPLSFPKIYNLI